MRSPAANASSSSFSASNVWRAQTTSLCSVARGVAIWRTGASRKGARESQKKTRGAGGGRQGGRACARRGLGAMSASALFEGRSACPGSSTTRRLSRSSCGAFEVVGERRSPSRSRRSSESDPKEQVAPVSLFWPWFCQPLELCTYRATRSTQAQAIAQHSLIVVRRGGRGDSMGSNEVAARALARARFHDDCDQSLESPGACPVTCD